MGRYWVMRNRHADALKWIARTLGLRGADAHPAMLVRCSPREVRVPMESRARSGTGRRDTEMVTIARRLGDPVIPSAPTPRRSRDR
jgi:hypothetical protein